MYKFHEAMEEQKKNCEKGEKTREIGELKKKLEKTQVKETEKNERVLLYSKLIIIANADPFFLIFHSATLQTSTRFGMRKLLLLKYFFLSFTPLPLLLFSTDVDAVLLLFLCCCHHPLYTLYKYQPNFFYFNNLY